jgi:hypothetical protein
MTDQVEAIQNLISLTSQIPDSPEKEWFNSAVFEWIRQPPSERKALEVYLGLNLVRSGKNKAATIIQKDKSRYHIREAVREAQTTFKLKKWPAICYVAKRLTTLDRKAIDKRKAKDSIESHLFQAVALDDDLPRSASGLSKAFKTPPVKCGFLAQK